MNALGFALVLVAPLLLHNDLTLHLHLRSQLHLFVRLIYLQALEIAAYGRQRHGV